MFEDQLRYKERSSLFMTIDDLLHQLKNTRNRDIKLATDFNKKGVRCAVFNGKQIAHNTDDDLQEQKLSKLWIKWIKFEAMFHRLIFNNNIMTFYDLLTYTKAHFYESMLYMYRRMVDVYVDDITEIELSHKHDHEQRDKILVEYIKENYMVYGQYLLDRHKGDDSRYDINNLKLNTFEVVEQFRQFIVNYCNDNAVNKHIKFINQPIQLFVFKQVTGELIEEKDDEAVKNNNDNEVVAFLDTDNDSNIDNIDDDDDEDDYDDDVTYRNRKPLFHNYFFSLSLLSVFRDAQRALSSNNPQSDSQVKKNWCNIKSWKIPTVRNEDHHPFVNVKNLLHIYPFLKYIRTQCGRICDEVYEEFEMLDFDLLEFPYITSDDDNDSVGYKLKKICGSISLLEMVIAPVSQWQWWFSKWLREDENAQTIIDKWQKKSPQQLTIRSDSDTYGHLVHEFLYCQISYLFVAAVYSCKEYYSIHYNKKNSDNNKKGTAQEIYPSQTLKSICETSKKYQKMIVNKYIEHWEKFSEEHKQELLRQKKPAVSPIPSIEREASISSIERIEQRLNADISRNNEYRLNMLRHDRHVDRTLKVMPYLMDMIRDIESHVCIIKASVSSMEWFYNTYSPKCIEWLGAAPKNERFEVSPPYKNKSHINGISSLLTRSVGIVQNQLQLLTSMTYTDQKDINIQESKKMWLHKIVESLSTYSRWYKQHFIKEKRGINFFMYYIYIFYIYIFCVLYSIIIFTFFEY